MGPNEGKSLLEQTRCVARALMSYSATELVDPGVVYQKFAEYYSKHEMQANEWMQVVLTAGEWYVHVEPHAIERGGKSRPDLPAGARVCAVIDLRPYETALLDKFDKAVELLRSRYATVERTGGFFQDETSEVPSGASPPPIGQAAAVLGGIVERQVRELEGSVKACRPDFNKGKIEKFRTWLRGFPDTSVPERPDVLLVGDPNRLVAFSKSLAEDHTRFGADTLLFGSVATMADICGYCASKAREHSKLANPTPPIVVFNDLASLLTSSRETDPVVILDGTVQRAVAYGFVDELLEIVQKYRGIVDLKRESAHSAGSVDEILSRFYEAMPFAWGALKILTVLRRKAAGAGDRRGRLIEVSYTMVDEELVRMQDAFKFQITDFNGRRWNEIRREITSAQEAGGTEAVRKVIDYVVEQHLYYPKSLTPALVGEPEAVIKR